MAPPPLNIVLVEDDASMSPAIKRLLEAAGWRVRAFLSAEALLESDEVESADGFVVDVHLPGLDGFALRERLIAEGATAAFVFITAHDLPSVRARAEEAGAAGLHIKPFVGARLIETLSRSCAGAPAPASPQTAA